MSQRAAGCLENDRRDLGDVTISFAQGLELAVAIDAGNSVGLVVLSQDDQDCTAEEKQDCQSYPELKVRDAALGIQGKSCCTRKCRTDHQQCSQFAAQHGFCLYFSINDCSMAAMQAWHSSLHGPPIPESPRPCPIFGDDRGIWRQVSMALLPKVEHDWIRT